MIHIRLLTSRRTAADRRAFTLVELLVVLVVILLLVAMTAGAINVGYSRDRVRGAARQVQSYLLAARDLAIYAKEPRGVRFLLDPTNPRQVGSMVLVQPTPSESYEVSIRPLDTTSPWDGNTNPLRRVRIGDINATPNWIELRNLNLLREGARIRIPADPRGSWYVIDRLDVDGPNQDLILTTAYRDPPAQLSPPSITSSGLIELPASIIPNKQPVPLPKGAVIDLDRCGVNPNLAVINNPAINERLKYALKLPSEWRLRHPTDPNKFRYSLEMDVMFSPQGTVTGRAGSSGIIHFYVTEQTAADLQLPAFYDPSNSATWPGTPTPSVAPFESVPDKTAVTVFTRTGGVIASPISPTTDPFFYAERGEVAGR